MSRNSLSRSRKNAVSRLEDADGVGMPVGLHHLLDHAEEVRHHLLLAVAERLVLEEEEADGEPVLEVLDAEERVDGLAQHRREDGIRRREQTVVGGRVERLEQRREPAFGEERELPGHGAGVGEVLALGERPRRHVEVVAHAPVAGGEDRAEERQIVPRDRRPQGGALGEVAQQRVALEELRLVLGKQPGERAGEPGERRVVLAGVDAREHVGGPGEQRPEQQ